MLISKPENVDLNHCNDPIGFYWIIGWYGWYKNIDECNPNKKRRILITFDDMLSKKKTLADSSITVIRSRKINISLVFIPQSYFAVPKNIRLNSTHCLCLKISNEWEL